jgi:SAM-dependent methyltransferase
LATRVEGQTVDIDYQATRRFFDARGSRQDLAHPYSVTMYQDDRPQLVAERDACEKARLLEWLAFSPVNRVLDVGCGVGRWADTAVPAGAAYLGIDFSEAILQRARERLPEVPGRVAFQRLGAEEVDPGVRWSLDPPFDRVLVSGVLIYLNDGDVRRCLDGIAAVAAERARVYLREPVSQGTRLSLSGHYSPALRAEYSAIYRPLAHYREVLAETLQRAGFRVLADDWLFDPRLENRSETRQRFFILERGA